MRSHWKAMLPLLVACTLVFTAQPAFAQQAAEQESESSQSPQQVPVNPPAQAVAVARPSHNAEISFFLGGFAGADLPSLLNGTLSLGDTLNQGRAFGGRIGYYTWPFGLEGSFAYSNSGLTADVSVLDVKVRLAATAMFTEANALLLILPGPVQPFVTAGGGYHSYQLADLPLSIGKFGWNFGGGLKINVSRISVRFDVRDHLTPSISAGDLGVDEALANAVGLNNQSLHNVEVSFGLGFKF